jgi:hypothetical protein
VNPYQAYYFVVYRIVSTNNIRLREMPLSQRLLLFHPSHQACRYPLRHCVGFRLQPPFDGPLALSPHSHRLCETVYTAQVSCMPRSIDFDLWIRHQNTRVLRDVWFFVSWLAREQGGLSHLQRLAARARRLRSCSQPSVPGQPL